MEGGVLLLTCVTRVRIPQVVGGAQLGQLRNRVQVLAGARDFYLLANPSSSLMCTGALLG